MKKTGKLFLIGCLLCLSFLNVKAEEETEVVSFTSRTITFDDNWVFQLEGQVAQVVTLPHDWSIYQEYTTQGEAESGFLLGGKATYQKTFIVPEEYENKRIVITFEGVYQYAVISLNGKQLAEHPYGYTSFSVDLSEDLLYGQKNELTVSVINEVPSSRWYSGSGIYRDVYLTCSEKTCIKENGIVVTNSDLTKTSVKTTIKTQVLKSDENTTVVSRLYDETGKEVGHGKSKITDGLATVTIASDEIHLWSLDDPYLYTVVSEVYQNNEKTDECETIYGYRSVAFDANTGFYLNGESIKIKGVCLHHDHGALGSVASKAAIDRQLDTVQEMGANAIRITHNPSNSYFLEQCAKRGILVIEEAFDTWTNVKNYNWNDYGSMFLETVKEDNQLLDTYTGEIWAEYDIKQMVRDARNNPSVILWSIGNEILGNIGGDISDYPSLSEQLCAWVNEEDGTRPCTIADNMTTYDDVPTQIEMDEAVVESGGVIGLNYATSESAEKYHTLYPDWCLYGSEVASTYGTRGEYATLEIDEDDYTVTAYDRCYVEWGSTANDAWLNTISNDYIAGEFVWTGYDYLGEPEPWNGLQEGSVSDGNPYPRSSYFGIVDTAGFKKDVYYYYQSQWREDITTLHILPCWHSDCLKKQWFNFVTVNVYSNAASVELFLNGKSLGKKSYMQQETENGYTYQTYKGKTYYSWTVWYQEGELTAKAYDEEGNEIQETSGRNTVSGSKESTLTSFTVEADQTTLLADGKDLSYITITLKDENGNVADFSSEEIQVEVQGKGSLVALDNGNQNDISGYHTTTKEAFHGLLRAIVQSSDEEGTIQVKVSVNGLGTKTIRLRTAEDGS